MRRAMLAILFVCMAACIIFALLYLRAGSGWMLSCAISFGTTAYHFAIRFLAALLLGLVTKRKYNYKAWWFRERKWEPGLYRLLRVKEWKGRVPTYDPGEFSLKEHTLQEIVCNMCHAELVHELIVVLSFSSLLFAIPFRAFWVFLITALLAALLDTSFVILQRYNRPRVVRLMEKKSVKEVNCPMNDESTLRNAGGSKKLEEME